jgi:hypothetical protein
VLRAVALVRPARVCAFRCWDPARELKQLADLSCALARSRSPVRRGGAGSPPRRSRSRSRSPVGARGASRSMAVFPRCLARLIPACPVARVLLLFCACMLRFVAPHIDSRLANQRCPSVFMLQAAAPAALARAHRFAVEARAAAAARRAEGAAAAAAPCVVAGQLSNPQLWVCPCLSSFRFSCSAL